MRSVVEPGGSLYLDPLEPLRREREKSISGDRLRPGLWRSLRDGGGLLLLRGDIL